MAIRTSTGLVTDLADSMSFFAALKNGTLSYYSGTQPATADAAPTGTLLATFTSAGGTFTGETRAAASVVLGGASGSIDAIKIGGAIPLIDTVINFTSDLTITAAAVAAAINAYPSIPECNATSAGATVTILGPVGLGADANGLTIAVTSTTMTATINGGSSSTIGGTGGTAGATAVNGLGFLYPAVAGVLTKEAATWQCVAAASGTAGWFRLKADPADDDSLSTVFRRVDGSISTAGADINLASTAIAAGATQTLSVFSMVVPIA